MNTELRETIDVIDQAIKQLQLIGDKTNNQLKEIDSEISNIYHYIEVNDLDLYRSWKTYKLLKVKLQKRRDIKNTLAVLTSASAHGIKTSSINAIRKKVLEKEKEPLTYRSSFVDKEITA